MAPGVSIPPGVEIPPGAVISPGTIIPPGWTPDDPAPPGMITPPVVPPTIPDTGTTPPTYVAPWEPGPIKQPVSYSPAGEIVQVISTTQDGSIRTDGYDWTTARNAASGNLPQHTIWYDTEGIMAEQTAGLYFRIRRSFFQFDLSAYAGRSIKTASLNITYHTNHESDACAQEGTQSDTLVNADIDNFTGPLFGTATWGAGLNTITFNAAGIAYLQSVIGAIAKICCREHAHDYLDVTPGVGAEYRNGLCFANNPTPAIRPYLELTF